MHWRYCSLAPSHRYLGQYAYKRHPHNVVCDHPEYPFPVVFMGNTGVACKEPRHKQLRRSSSKYMLLVHEQMKIRSGHNYARATTVELSWHMQNYDLIGSLELKWERNEFFARFQSWAPKPFLKWVASIGVSQNEHLRHFVVLTVARWDSCGVCYHIQY